MNVLNQVPKLLKLFQLHVIAQLQLKIVLKKEMVMLELLYYQQINNNIKISVEVSKYKEDEYIIAVYISYPIKCKELVYSDLNKKIELKFKKL